MKRGKAKVLAFWCVVWAVPLVLAAVLVYRAVYREDMLLDRLKSESVAERNAAALSLADMNSLKAVPQILRMIDVEDVSDDPKTATVVEEKPGLGMFKFSPGDAIYVDAVSHITRNLKNAAVPPLLEELRGDDTDVRVLAAFLLGELGAQGTNALPALEDVIQGTTERLLRLTAEQAVRKIQGKEGLLGDRLRKRQEENRREGSSR